MKALTATLFCLTALATQAQASSSDAWADYYKAMNESCVTASGLKNVKAVGKPAEYDDRVDYAAVLLQGTYPQKHMKGAAGTELCLYNKKSKTAYITEWDSIRPAGKTK
ncbi:hypothetical protein RG836_21585 [Pseudomonas sp. SZMC_28357]|uniref:hypothetical protein n=1 Tax=Pseudomonas sp. SZMC_28357 TaxID=3074380 RepID=UPI00287228F2|nr:hypothetical protein [Pseudomonas sp. SZMC_28357]MDR9754051.1 hypothetical protein [Pseudomonas sp. SZMC_28357]